MEQEYEVAVGDTVLEQNGRSVNEGTVTKIGRKLIHVTTSHGSVTTYYKDTRQRSDGYPGYVQTLAQKADSERRKAAKELLRAHGIQPEWTAEPPWTVDQLERLVEAVVAIRNPPETV